MDKVILRGARMTLIRNLLIIVLMQFLIKYSVCLKLNFVKLSLETV
jgi:hypothetical protein